MGHVGGGRAMSVDRAGLALGLEASPVRASEQPEAAMLDEAIERLRIVDPYHKKFIRIHEHMHVVFNFNRPSDERIASLQAIRDILEED